jgi:hypothetical protein
MAITFKYLDYTYTFDQNYYEFIFVISLVINTFLMPKIVLLARKKKSDILDPFINSSYSSISIMILNLLIYLGFLQFIDGLTFIAYIIFFNVSGADPDKFNEIILNIPLYIGKVTFALGQLLVLAQVYEYMIMIHSVLF